MSWFLRNWDQVAVALWQHIVISVTSLSIAFVISIVVGIVAARNERVFRWSLGVSGILYTIPTLAFLALLIPDRRARPHERDHLHGGVFADDHDPQRRDRPPRSAGRRGRGGEGNGDERRRDPAPDRAAARASGDRRRAADRDRHRDQRRRRRRLRERRRTRHAHLQRHQQRPRAEDLDRRIDRLRAGGRRRHRPLRGSSIGCAAAPRDEPHAARRSLAVHPRASGALPRRTGDAYRAVGIGARHCDRDRGPDRRSALRNATRRPDCDFRRQHRTHAAFARRARARDAGAGDRIRAVAVRAHACSRCHPS